MKKILLTLLAFGGAICYATAQDLEQMVAKQIKANFPKGVEQAYNADKTGKFESFVDTCTVNVFFKKTGRVSIPKTMDANQGNPSKLYEKIEKRVYSKIQLPVDQVKSDTVISVVMPTRYRLVKLENESTSGFAVSPSPTSNNSTLNMSKADFYNKQAVQGGKQVRSNGASNYTSVAPTNFATTIQKVSKQYPTVSVFEIELDF